MESKILLNGIVTAFMVLTVILTGNGPSFSTEPVNLVQFKWNNRLLLLFAPNDEDPSFKSMQQSLAAGKPEVSDRDLVVFQVFESGKSTMDSVTLDDLSVRWLQERYNIRKGRYAVILIGKDGGIKLDRAGQITLAEVFALIDSMPMRREEMRQKAK